MVVISAALGIVAWLAARRNWDRHGKTWQAIGSDGVAKATETKDTTPPGDWPLQVVAGFNILIIAGLIAIGAGRIASLFVTTAYQTGAGWLVAVVGVLVFGAAWFVLTKVGPLLKPGVHVLVWGAVALAALFASAPVGVLLLTGALVATAGRQIAKWQRPAGVASGLIGLEYWFFYPFNYYPIVINDGLMNQAPIAGDRANVDLHQGDWEHVDVLLDPRTMQPEWLYLARHDFEGAFVPWNSPMMRFDDGHPVIQAAFGGHPSYLPGCGAGPREVARAVTADWLSCGSGRFAFRAASTPLVDVQAQPWACWQGYFGENGVRQASPTAKTDYLASLHLTRFATPPRGPLVQAENTGVCQNGRPTGLP